MKKNKETTVEKTPNLTPVEKEIAKKTLKARNIVTHKREEAPHCFHFWLYKV